MTKINFSETNPPANIVWLVL